MAITTNYGKSNPNMIDQSVKGGDWCFQATKSDANYLEDPLHSSGTSRPLVSKAISLDIATQAVKVTFADGRTHTFPAGSLAAGVPHPMNIVQVWSTGTGADVLVQVWVVGEPQAAANLNAGIAPA